MATPNLERRDDALTTIRESRSGGDGLTVVKKAVFRKLEQSGVIAALQLVADLRRRRLPTLPNLRTPDPANPAKSIEEGGVLVIGERYIEIHGQRQKVSIIALFPEEIPPRVEFRSYRQIITESVLGRTFLVSVGPLIEGHSLIFANAEKSTQQELIGLALEAIYRKPTGGSSLLKP